MRLLEESFLLAIVKPDIVFGIFFLIMSNINVNFKDWDLEQRFYTIKKILPTIIRVKSIKKKEFVIAAFDIHYKTFVIYLSIFNISLDINDKVYPLSKAQIAHLKVDEAFIEVLSKYTNFADVF